MGYNDAFDNDTYEVIIDQDGYGGLVGDFNLVGLKFNWEGEGKDRINPILTSTCSLSLLIDSTVNSFIINLIAGAEDEFKVLINKNGSLYWMGYIVTDLVTRENKPYPALPVFEIQAVDGVGRLQKLDYDVTPGQTTIKAHLQNIITEIGLLDFGYANATDKVLSYLFFWQEENATVSMSPPGDILANYRIDSRVWRYVDRTGAYKYASYYDVLKAICTGFNARFLWSEGMYRFHQINEMRYRTIAPTTVYINEWEKGGTHSATSTANLGIWNKTVTTDTDWQTGASDLVLFSGSLFKYYPPLKTVRVNYNHFSGQNLTPDWSWNEGYTSVKTYQTIDYVNGTARLRVNATLSYRVDFSSGFDFSFNYSQIKFRLRIKVGSYYLKRTAIFGAAGYAYGQIVWTTDSGAYYEFYGAGNTLDNQQYQQQIDITTPVLAASGDLDMKFEFVELVAYTGLVIGSGFTEYHTFGAVHVEVLQNGVIQDQYNQNNYIVANPNTGNSEQMELTISFGSGPTANNIGHIQAWDGLGWVTGENWRYGTSGSYVPHGQLLAEDIISAQVTPVKRFLATMRGVYEAHYRLKHNTTDYYIFMGGTFDIGSDEWAGEWFLISRDTTGLVASITQNYGGIVRNNLGPDGLPPPLSPMDPPLPSFPGNQTEGFFVPAVVVTQTDATISEGATVTTISIPAAGGDLLNSGDTITLVSPSGDVQQFTLTADVDAGDTTISVSSTTAATDFPSGSWVIPDPEDFYNDAVVNAGGACYEEIFLPDQDDVSVKITINSGTWPADMDCVFVFRNGVYQVYGMSNDYYTSGADAVFNMAFDAGERVVIKFHV
jgi:hypothetical protein